MCWPLVLLQLKASALSQLDTTTNGVPILTLFRLKKMSCDTHAKNKILRRLISFSLLATNCPSLRRESNVLTKNKGMAAIATRSQRRLDLFVAVGISNKFNIWPLHKAIVFYQSAVRSFFPPLWASSFRSSPPPPLLLPVFCRVFFMSCRSMIRMSFWRVGRTAVNWISYYYCIVACPSYCCCCNCSLQS